MKEGRRPGAGGCFSCELGSYKPEGKSEPEVRQETGDITEYRGERVQKNITSLKDICYFFFQLSTFYLQPFILFPICIPFQINFCLASAYFKVSSPTFFYFLPIPYPIHCFFSSTTFYFFLRAALPVSLTLRGDTVIFLPLCPTPWLFPHVESTVWKRRIDALASLSKFDLEMD